LSVEVPKFYLRGQDVACLNIYMSKIALLILLLPVTVKAQSIRIEKVKDDKAIVEVVEGVLTPGETYQLNASAGAGNKFSTRKNVIGFSGGFTNSSRASTATSVSYTTFTLDVKYGLNKTTMEFGGLASLDYASTTGASATGFMLGGFFDYNLVPHKASSDMVYGIGVQAAGGSAQSPALTTYKAVSAYKVFGGGFLKWFPFKTTTCVRTDLGFQYINYSESPTITESGLTGFFGLAHYF
jgi:hypothetical protein